MTPGGAGLPPSSNAGEHRAAALIGLPLRTGWNGAVVLAAFALTPLMAYLGPLGFAALAALAGLLLTPAWFRRREALPVLLVLAGLLVWAAGTVGWSAARPRAFADYGDVENLTILKLTLQLALYGAFAVAAMRLSGIAGERAMRVLALGLVGLALVLVVEGLSGAALYQWLKATFEDPIRPDLAVRNVGQGSVVLALLAWPALLYLRIRTPWAVFVLSFAILVSSVLLRQASPAAGFLAGGVAAWLVGTWGKRGAWVVGGLLALQVLLTPWLVHSAEQAGLLARMRDVLPASWEARLVIWPYVAERVLEHPGLGWGLDASRTIGGPVPLHPHNASLQIWLELGAVGAALIALLWAWIFVGLGQVLERDKAGAAACAGAASAYFTIGALSYGAWQEWWLALAALTAAVCGVLLTARARSEMAEPPRALRGDGLTPL